MGANSEKVCLFPDCGRPIRTKKSGLCNSHYRMFCKGIELRPLANSRRVYVKSVCNIPDCNDEHYANGYCRFHWRKDKYHGDPLFVGKIHAYPDGAVCIADGCNDRPTSHWRCPKHLNRMNKFGSDDLPDGIKGRQECAIRDIAGNKHCSKCDTWKSESEFYRNSRQIDGLSYQCKGCENLAIRDRRYNIDSVSILDNQQWLCESCGETLTRISETNVDHNHDCCDIKSGSCGSCVRGIICMPCNLMLGVAKDDPNRLRAGAGYLERKNLA